MNFDLLTMMEHKPPMLLVDEIQEAGDDYIVTAFSVRPDTLFLDGGVLRTEALAEVMAQSVAALNAYKAWKNGKPSEKGFLVMLKKVVFSGEAAVGDTLRCRMEITDFLAQTYIANGQVCKEGRVIADGEIRIYAWG